MKKIVFFTGSRSEYGLLHPVVKEFIGRSLFEVSLFISGGHLLEAFGHTEEEIDTTGIKQIVRIPLGNGAAFQDRTGVPSAFSKLVQDGGALLSESGPDFVFLAGDRYESFAMATAAFYSNIPIAHLFGGDLSCGGHLDDSVRHCITKLAHLHFTTNRDSYQRVLALGEEPWRVFQVGSPLLDHIAAGEYTQRDDVIHELGIDPRRPLILFTQHPVTTESELAYTQVKEGLEALSELNYQTLITYPCADPGSTDIIRAIGEYADCPHFKVRKNLGWKLYLGCLKMASCVVGNSSSGLLETPFFKIPCIDIGSRQTGRLKAENVLNVPCQKEAIKAALVKALSDQEFLAQVRRCSNPYRGEGTSKQIAHVLETTSPRKKLLQKKMCV